MDDTSRTGPYQPEEPISTAVVSPSNRLPEWIGRYRIEKVLGKGGFGLVYLAHDDQLQRLVAIKVPHARLVAQATDAEAYLTEARTVANLDHPHIVPVHDVGSTEQRVVPDQLDQHLVRLCQRGIGDLDHRRAD